MADRASAERAYKDPNPIIDGRKANVNLAYLGAKPRVLQSGEDVLREVWAVVPFKDSQTGQSITVDMLKSLCAEFDLPCEKLHGTSD